STRSPRCGWPWARSRPAWPNCAAQAPRPGWSSGCRPAPASTNSSATTPTPPSTPTSTTSHRPPRTGPAAHRTHPNGRGEPAMADTAIHKGLAGVVADTTAISTVDAATDSLTYRGYPVQDLAETRTFEEVAHLIWTGDLPDREQLTAFTARERAGRALDRSTLDLLRRVPESAHPMDVLRTAISYLGADDPAEDRGADLATAERLMARLPSVVAADRRRRH